MSNEKEEIKKELDEMGVEYDGRLGEDSLQALLDEQSDNPKDEAIVKRGNVVVRTYTKEVHGKDFVKLAETYVSTRNDDELSVE
jgi:hypothetical protein